MHLRNLKIIRTVKYKNTRIFFKNKSKIPIRSGDKVKVIRGSKKNTIGNVVKVFSNFVYIDCIFSKNICSSKYTRNNEGKRIEVNNYLKIDMNNVVHVDKNDKDIDVAKKRITCENSKKVKSVLVDVSNGDCVIDNFVQNVKEKRRIKEEMYNKERNKENIEKEEAQQNTQNDGNQNIEDVQEETDKHQDS